MWDLFNSVRRPTQQAFSKSSKFTKLSTKFLTISITLLKKILWHRCFPVSFAKSLKTPILQNTYPNNCFYKNRLFSDIYVQLVIRSFSIFICLFIDCIGITFVRIKTQNFGLATSLSSKWFFSPINT